VYRDTREAIEKIRLLAPTGERVSLAQLTKVVVSDGGSEIYREANSRYIAVKYSVRGRDLGGTVEEAIKKVKAAVKLSPGYAIDWAGEYESQQRSQRRLLLVLPVTILLIFIILYAMFRSMKWALLILTNVAMARIGGLLALLLTHTNFNVSSGVGFLALFGFILGGIQIVLPEGRESATRRLILSQLNVQRLRTVTAPTRPALAASRFVASG
jgi:heavy metal efflux system protein